ncbi:hypothetical protein TNCV_3803501 [Trichonephila clavipes]|nr:hypothetical protein TNCV_3803501 [Trichonephila clavipes]
MSTTLSNYDLEFMRSCGPRWLPENALVIHRLNTIDLMLISGVEDMHVKSIETLSPHVDLAWKFAESSTDQGVLLVI